LSSSHDEVANKNVTWDLLQPSESPDRVSLIGIDATGITNTLAAPGLQSSEAAFVAYARQYNVPLGVGASSNNSFELRYPQSMSQLYYSPPQHMSNTVPIQEHQAFFTPVQHDAPSAVLQITLPTTHGIEQHLEYLPADVGTDIRISNSSILDSVAHQILRFIAEREPTEMIGIAAFNPQGDGDAQAYHTALDLFRSNKQCYARDGLFIPTKTLPLQRADFQATIRKANLATFASILYCGLQVVPYAALSDHFRDIFVPAGQRISISDALLFVELKTQAYIARMLESAVSRKQTVFEVFPEAMPSGTVIPEEEQHLLGLIVARKQELLDDPDPADMLMQKYHWLTFLERLQKRVQAALHAFEHPTTFDSAIANFAEPRYSIETGVTPAIANLQDEVTSPVNFEARNVLHKQMTHKTRPLSFSQPSEELSEDLPWQQPAAFALEKHTIPSSSLNPVSSMVQQYEHARAMANTNGSAPRRVTVPSQRRSWSDDELQALMNGLDAVKGPHWSQILALYGQGGSISEVLKNRNQVQLKDKARNLKLFFLKSGVEVPEYLKGVTGDLRSRAPGVARRKERERAKGQGQGQMSVPDTE